MVHHGFYACRANVEDQMIPRKLYQEQKYFQLLKEIKRVVDPNNILAPGKFVNVSVSYEEKLE